jgi:hypothetical protein
MDDIDCHIFEQYQKVKYSEVAQVARKIVTENKHDQQIKRLLHYVRVHVSSGVGPQWDHFFNT